MLLRNFQTNSDIWGNNGVNFIAGSQIVDIFPLYLLWVIHGHGQLHPECVVLNHMIPWAWGVVVVVSVLLLCDKMDIQTCTGSQEVFVSERWMQILALVIIFFTAGCQPDSAAGNWLAMTVGSMASSRSSGSLSNLGGRKCVNHGEWWRKAKQPECEHSYRNNSLMLKMGASVVRIWKTGATVGKRQQSTPRDGELSVGRWIPEVQMNETKDTGARGFLSRREWSKYNINNTNISYSLLGLTKFWIYCELILWIEAQMHWS